MSYRSAVRPLCRTCGKGIAKRTTHHTFGYSGAQAERTPYWVEHPEVVHSKEEAQRYINEPIVSVRGGYRCISVSSWDGESWKDEFFCTGSCAQTFGYFAMRHPGAETKAYADAIRKRKTRK